MDFINGILHILSDLGFVNLQDVHALIENFDSSEADYFEDFLVDEDIVDKGKMLRALEMYYGVQSVDVLGEMFDHNLLVMFPKHVLLRNCCIPYRHEGQILTIITNNPNNENLEEILGEYVSYDFRLCVGIPSHIDMMIKDFYQDELYHDQDEYETNLDRERLDREMIQSGNDMDLD